MISGRAYVNAKPSQLIWMNSWSTIFVERDAAVLVDNTTMPTSGLRIVSISLLVTHSQTRWKLILHFFGHHIFVFQHMCGIFPVFFGLFLDLLGHRWVGNTSVPELWNYSWRFCSFWKRRRRWLESKICFHRVCECVTKSELLTIRSPLMRILVISTRTAVSRSTKIVLQDFIQMSYKRLAFA